MRGCLHGHSSSCRLLLDLPLCQTRQAQLSQSLLWGQVMAILIAFCWTLLNSSSSFTNSRAPNWAQLSRHSLFSGGAPLTCWLHLPQCGPVLAFQVHREAAPWLIFTLAPTVVPGTSSRAVSQAATFQLYLCVRLFFPRCRTLRFCLLSFGNSCCSSSQVSQVCCELKPYHSVHQLFLHLVLSSHFPSKCSLPYDPWWRWGTMPDPERTPSFSLCYWLPAGLWAIDYCEPNVQAIFNISNSSVSPQFLSFMSFWGRLCQKPKCIITTALPCSMQLIISSQKAIGLVTDGLHLVNLCWVFLINFFSFTFLKIYSLLS